MDPRAIASKIARANEVRCSLEKIRSTADSWRTGMAGLVTLVTGTLLFKGQAAIADYDVWVRYTLGVLTLFALIFGTVSLWLFLSAAHGRVRPVSAQSILDEGGVDIRNIHLATTALDDLRSAQRLAIASALSLAVALVLSWYAPTKASEPIAFVRVAVRSEHAFQIAEIVCGELTAQDGTTTIIRVKGEPSPRIITTQKMISLILISQC